MLVRDGLISDSLHELRKRKKRGGKWLGLVGWVGIQKQPDKLPVDLSRVINYQPGKGLRLGLSVTYSRVTHMS